MHGTFGAKNPVHGFEYIIDKMRYYFTVTNFLI